MARKHFHQSENHKHHSRASKDEPVTPDHAQHHLEEDASLHASASQHGPQQQQQQHTVEIVDVSSTSVALGIFPDANTEHASTSPAGQPESQNAISIRINSENWPHVVHSDATFIQQDSHAEPGDSGTTVVIYNLQAGREYEIELEVLSPTTNAPPPLTPTPTRTRSASPASMAVGEQRSQLPRDPPPPYSSHDPSAPSSPEPQALTALQKEVQFKAILSKLKVTTKASEAALQGPLQAIKRTLEKSAKEDLRTRQRISTLEEATRKLKETTQLEEQELQTIQDEMEPLEAESAQLGEQVNERKERYHQIEVDTKKTIANDQFALKSLVDELEELKLREEDVAAERERYENVVIPDLQARLASLEEELRMSSDPTSSGSSSSSLQLQQQSRSRSNSMRFRAAATTAAASGGLGNYKKMMAAHQAQAQAMEAHHLVPSAVTMHPVHGPIHSILPPLASSGQRASTHAAATQTPPPKSKKTLGLFNTPLKGTPAKEDSPQSQLQPQRRQIPGLPSSLASSNSSLKKHAKSASAAANTKDNAAPSNDNKDDIKAAGPSDSPTPAQSTPRFLAHLRRRSGSLVNNLSSSPKALTELTGLSNSNSTSSITEESALPESDRISVDSKETTASQASNSKASWSRVVGRHK